MQGTIDIVVNLFTPEEVRLGQTGFDASFTSRVRMPEAMKTGVEMDDNLGTMDRAGIERSRLIAVRAGDWPCPARSRFRTRKWRPGGASTLTASRAWPASSPPAACRACYMGTEAHGLEGYTAYREGRAPNWKVQS